MIEEKYKKVMNQAAAINPAQTHFAREQMAQLVEESIKCKDILTKQNMTNQNIASKSGFMAETFHAHTFNNEAILKGDSTRAITDNSLEWAGNKWKGGTLGKNDIPDIALVKEGNKVIKTYQSKYYKNTHDTTGAMSAVKDGQIKYKDVDGLLGPSDQVPEIPKQAQINIEKNQLRNGAPIQREAYAKTAEKCTSKISNGKISSAELSKSDSERLGKGDLKKVEELDKQYQRTATFQQMGKAAMGAAAFTAVFSGVMNTVTYMQMVRDGKISESDAALKIVGETAASAADSAVKAALQVGVNAYLVREASKKAVTALLVEQGVKSMLKGNAVTVGVVCAVDAVKDLVKLGTGKITKEDFFERQGKNLLNTSVCVVGGDIGVVAATAAASSLGLATGTLGCSALIFAGGLSGGLIAGVALNLAIENCIEAPYRDLLKNTECLKNSIEELRRTCNVMTIGQQCMTKFVEESYNQDQKFNFNYDSIEKAQNQAIAAIERLKKIRY